MIRGTLTCRSELVPRRIGNSVCLNRSAEENLPALFAAVESGDVGSFRQHLTDKKLLSCLSPAGSSLAYEAARRGHVDCLRAILAQGGDPDISNANSLTPLVGAIEGGSLECVKILLEAGADVHHKIESGDTAMFMAAYHGMAETISLLAVQRGWMVVASAGDSCLSVGERRKCQREGY